MVKTYSRASRFLQYAILSCFLLLAIAVPFFNVSLRSFLIGSAILVIALLVLNYQIVASKQIGKKAKTLTDRIANQPHFKLALIIGLTAFCLRLIVALVMFRYNVQTAESETAFNNSSVFVTDWVKVQSYAPHWMLYSTYLYPLTIVLGSSQLVGMLFNAIVTSAGAALIYFIGYKVFSGKKAVGFCGGLLYALWPSSILYISVYDPAHPTTLVFLGCILLAVHAISAREWRKRIIMFAVLGLACSFMIFLKGTYLLVIVPLVVYLVIKLVADRTKDSLMRLACILITIVMLAPGTLLYSKVITEMTSKEPVDFLPYTLMVGLGGNNNGSLLESPELGKDWLALLAEHTPAEAADIEYSKFFDTMHGRITELPITFYNKLHIATMVDEHKINWITVSNTPQNPGLAQTITVFAQPFNAGYYFTLIALMIIAAVSLWRSSRQSKQLVLSPVYFIILIIVIYLAMLLVMELQERYRYIIEPYYCVLAGYGLYTLATSNLSITKLIDKVKQN